MPAADQALALKKTPSAPLHLQPRWRRFRLPHLRRPHRPRRLPLLLLPPRLRRPILHRGSTTRVDDKDNEHLCTVK